MDLFVVVGVLAVGLVVDCVQLLDDWDYEDLGGRLELLEEWF